MKKLEKMTLQQRCIEAYKDYLTKFHIDPSAKDFTEFWKLLDLPEDTLYVDWRKGYKNVTELRAATFKQFPDIVNLTFNESDFTDDYEIQLEEEIKKHKKFIVSTIVTGKTAHAEFYKSAQTFAKHNDAMLILLPSQDVKSTKKQFEFNFDPIFKGSWVLSKGLYLNTNLYFEDIRQSAKQKNQIASLEKGTSYRNASILVSGTKQQLKYVPTFKNRIPHAVMTTGAMTLNDYTNDYYMSARTSRFAEWDHQYGAIIIEVENDKIFHFRQVQAAEDGSFTDINKVYHPDGTVTEAHQSVLVMGDSHAGMEDARLIQAIVGSLLYKCDISEIVLHDLCNSSSCSHHEVNDSLILAQRASDGTNSVINEIKKVGHYLNNLAALNPSLSLVVVNSNHDEHIDRAVRELRCVSNRDSLNQPILLDLWCKMNQDRSLIPLQYLINTYADVKTDRIKWLKLDESYEVYGTELGLHGHLGANGARGSLKTFEKTLRSAVVGHSHSGAIQCGIFQVGTTSELEMGYNKGLSSWTRTCCLVHSDGTKQLINFIPTETGYHYTTDSNKEDRCY